MKSIFFSSLMDFYLIYVSFKKLYNNRAVFVGCLFLSLFYSWNVYAQKSSAISSSVSSVSPTTASLSVDEIKKEQIKKLTVIYHSWGYTSPEVLAKIAVDHSLDRKTLRSKAKAPEISDSHWLNRIQIDGQRFSTTNDLFGTSFPEQLTCTIYDKRTFHFCLEPEFFLPSARVYFDRGEDGENRLDMFNNGRVNINLDFASIYLPWRIGHAEFFDNWSWGPQVGLGITTSSIKAEENSEEKEGSSSPVVMTSVGLKVRYKTSDNGANIGFELGKGWGYSADESFADIKDRAYYVGLSLKVALPDKK